MGYRSRSLLYLHACQISVMINCRLCAHRHRQMAQSMMNNLSWGVGMLFFCLCLLFMQTETFHRPIFKPCVFLTLPFVGAESLQFTLLESYHPLNTQKLDAARVVVVVASLPLAGHELFRCLQGDNPLCPV